MIGWAKFVPGMNPAGKTIFIAKASAANAISARRALVDTRKCLSMISAYGSGGSLSRINCEMPPALAVQAIANQ